ncbi:Zona pellucida domain-containing protein [Aphelenchoides fujianensis]|nr:Zona pellucida domain-containing protein [Aphelenchoides fujianensis]
MKLRHLRLPLLAVALLPLLAAAEFSNENEITGEPEIECGYGVAHFTVRTSKDRPSQIFVKGNSGNPDCVFHNTGNVTIELNKCNIRRKREANPAGVAYQMTVIVQLHPLFVTKRDRAYRLECVYAAQQQRVEFDFGVSDLTTQTVANDAPIPTCQYSVHRDSPNGPIIQYSKVGEVLFHVWNCKSDMYAMLLSHCKVVDGTGTEYQLIDANGCSTDRYLFPQISYSADVTTAMVQTTAFNFPDRNQLYFSCKIRLCFKSDNCQAVTPPKCDRAGGRSTTEASVELAGHGDASTLTNDLNDEQLITSTESGLSSTEERAASSTTTERSTTSESPSSTPSSTTEQTTTKASTTTTGNAAFFIPSDFPRPAFLPQGDTEGSGEAASDIPEVDAWMVSEEPQQRDRKSNDSAAPPLQLLKKPAATSTTSSPKASRQQRDAAPKRMVDFDITAPELTILEDYSDSDSSAGIQPQRQFRDLNAYSNGRGICFSPAALVCAVGLFALLCIVVVFVLLKTRKAATHKFY